jgi:hypothetical protein
MIDEVLLSPMANLEMEELGVGVPLMQESQVRLLRGDGLGKRSKT